MKNRELLLLLKGGVCSISGAIGYLKVYCLSWSLVRQVKNAEIDCVCVLVIRLIRRQAKIAFSLHRSTLLLALHSIWLIILAQSTLWQQSDGVILEISVPTKASGAGYYLDKILQIVWIWKLDAPISIFYINRTRAP